MTPSNLPWRPGKQARSSRPSAGSRLRRWLVGGVVVGCAGSALNVTLVVTSASGTGTALYAYAAGRATSPATCPRTTSTNEQCTLGEAVSRAVPGTKVLLASPGRAGAYVGNWTVSAVGTTSSQPITIEPARGRRPAHPGREHRAKHWLWDQHLRRPCSHRRPNGTPRPQRSHHPKCRATPRTGWAVPYKTFTVAP